MEVSKFKDYLIYTGDLPKDFDWSRYTRETGRPVPEEIRNRALDSILFVSWVRSEITRLKKGEAK